MDARDDPLLAPGERLVLVSNRLPVILGRDDDGRLTTQASSGGLATGLSGPHRDSAGAWIGWHGLTEEEGGDSEDVRAALAERGMRGVGLDATELEAYYNRISNGCIWPLFHYFTEKVRFSSDDWAVYESVNRKFAEATLEFARPGDLVFVQDFHLMLVPGMLREAMPELSIGFFLHIPFPSSEIFRIFPPRVRVLQGLLGADMVAFHTLDYVRHFRSSVRRVLGVEARTSEIHYAGRRVRLLAQPLGLEARAWEERARSEAVERELERLVEAAAGRRVILGVERLDYTKGIPERLRAFRVLLERDPGLAERVMMIQVAVPSRIDVTEYRELKDDVDRLAGSINSEFGRTGLQPLHYEFRSVPPEVLSAMYRLADVALVTPLRDGLNLVAKEFVASRVDDSGVLVLGEFAGAIWELGEALHVNPFDPSAVADQLERALAMPPDEQRRRMAPMRARVRRNDVHLWTRRCLAGIRAGGTTPAPPPFSDEDRARATEEWRSADQRALFLDYDGTLREFTAQPEEAEPTVETLELLRRLARAPGVDAWIVSGRPGNVLDRWLGSTGVGLIAEHGAFVRRPEDGAFVQLRSEVATDWRPSVLAILRSFADRVPGSVVEEKPLGLAWHYRAGDPVLATWQARELFQHLGEVLGGQGLEIMRGSKVIEVRPAGMNKSTAILAMLEERTPRASFVFAAGDDTTDETTFGALDPPAWTVLIGDRESAARHRLPDPAALHRLLAEWLELLPD